MNLKELFKDFFNVPNMLCVLRVLATPVFAGLYIKGYFIAAVVVLAVASSTDFFDGFIARKFNQITPIGKILDPLADKLTQVAIVIAVVTRHWDICIAVAPFLIMFVIKELLMVIAGILLLKKRINPPGARWWGKLSTAVFYAVMLAIVCFNAAGHPLSSRVVTALVSVVAVLMLFSFINYLPVFFKLYSNKAAE